MVIHQLGNSRNFFNYDARIYRDIFWQAHFHGNYELIYVLEGEVPVKLNGTEILLSCKEMLLISPYAVHSFLVGSDACAWVGVFSDDFVPYFSKNNEGLQFSKFTCSFGIDEFLKERLFVITDTDVYMRMSCLYMVCSECLENALPMNTKTDRKFMNNAIEYISREFENDITLKNLAERYGYEYHYCSSIFNRCFSMNFKSFLNIFRVERACELLGEDNLEITEIYESCGFSSIRNFNRVFKDVAGCTPSEYRSGKIKV